MISKRNQLNVIKKLKKEYEKFLLKKSLFEEEKNKKKNRIWLQTIKKFLRE